MLAAVRQLNRLELVGKTLRAALGALAAAALAWLAGWMDPAWQQQYGTQVGGYRLPTAEDERAALARWIDTDGYRLLAAVAAPSAPPWLQDIPAVTVLRAVWLQQYHRVVNDGAQQVQLRSRDDLPPQ